MTLGPADALRDAGLRVTSGRVAVLEALHDMPHSDAERLFQSLKQHLPGLSVQSVHNVLGDLTAVGLLRRIQPSGSPARYERRTGDNHHHLVCTECGAITDVDCAHGEAPCLTPVDAAGYTVTTAEVTYWGLCPACSATAS
ncbi:MAG: transcriptional repressor [Cryobacterium sp.]|nr:transcriptional repressor [Cryobacterium sp.]